MSNNKDCAHRLREWGYERKAIAFKLTDRVPENVESYGNAQSFHCAVVAEIWDGVTTGLMPLKSDTGEVEARVFIMAYTLDRSGGPETRPVMFSFNGGPGSSSVWLHLGALGPKRVKMRTDGAMPSPPYRLVDNEHTWLDETDLVFIDPVGTGYSRPAKPELGKKFWGVQGDIESVGEFIRLYLTRHERWGSPLFLVGESYGTTRAAGLAGHLVERGIAFNGILLVSSILNFQTARFTRGNDLPYPLFLPTYAATACYHKKLPAELQAKPVAEFLREVEAFAGGEYPAALQQGDRMSAAERQAVVQKLSVEQIAEEARRFAAGEYLEYLFDGARAQQDQRERVLANMAHRIDFDGPNQ